VQKVIQKEIQVQIDERKVPKAFAWRSCTYRVQKVIDVWEETGEWWDKATPRTVYRVLTPQGTYELHFLQQPKRWILYSIDD
jgi:hypothetical protein